MRISVHIPKPLLEALDRRAEALQISRNRLILMALERELAPETRWSAGFLESLAAADARTVEAVDDLTKAVRAARRSKAPRPL